MDPNPAPSSPNPWLARAVVILLCAQLGMSWVQGRLLHRQHQDLVELRGEMQYLTDSIEQGSAEAGPDETSLAPARQHRHHRGRHLVRVSHIGIQEDGTEQATKDLDAAKASAQKAVKDARKVQGQLSIEENARKAEEKAKVKAIENSGTKWIFASIGVGLLALVVRAWLRRRG
ncbi:MAG: hypothetical protein IPN59_09830 [Holophaga sp.]|nr:hypothetical protein [Holophaga sp.]